MKICSPNLLFNRPSNRDPSERDFSKQAKVLFSFNTTIAVKKPPASKKRKVEVERAAGEEILAQVPLSLPEPEEIVVPRPTRTRR